MISHYYFAFSLLWYGLLFIFNCSYYDEIFRGIIFAFKQIYQFSLL